MPTSTKPSFTWREGTLRPNKDSFLFKIAQSIACYVNQHPTVMLFLYIPIIVYFLIWHPIDIIQHHPDQYSQLHGALFIYNCTILFIVTLFLASEKNKVVIILSSLLVLWGWGTLVFFVYGERWEFYASILPGLLVLAFTMLKELIQNPRSFLYDIFLALHAIVLPIIYLLFSKRQATKKRSSILKFAGNIIQIETFDDSRSAPFPRFISLKDVNELHRQINSNGLLTFSGKTTYIRSMPSLAPEFRRLLMGELTTTVEIKTRQEGFVDDKDQKIIGIQQAFKKSNTDDTKSVSINGRIWTYKSEHSILSGYRKINIETPLDDNYRIVIQLRSESRYRIPSSLYQKEQLKILESITVS